MTRLARVGDWWRGVRTDVSYARYLNRKIRRLRRELADERQARLFAVAELDRVRTASFRGHR